MEQDKIVWYLSGPMTGIEEYNFPAFAKAAKFLRDQGLEVVSAHEIKHEDNGVPGSLTWDAYLRGDLIEMLKKCNGIILLPGWENSKGASLEFQLAIGLNFNMKTFDPDVLARL
jgi:hypothetical protein